MSRKYKVVAGMLLGLILNHPNICFAAALTVSTPITTPVNINPNLNNPLTVTTTGSITTPGAIAVMLGPPTPPIPSGAVSIGNDGTISTTLPGVVAISLPGSSNQATVTNSGTIIGGIDFGGNASTLYITNGNISGSVTGAASTLNSIAPNYVSSSLNSFSIATFNVNSGTFTSSTGISVSGWTTVSGTLTITSGGQLSTGMTQVNGVLNLTGGTLTTTNTINMSVGSTINVNDGSSINNLSFTGISSGENLNIASSVAGTTAAITNIDNITVQEDGIVTFGSNITNVKNLTIEVGGAANFLMPLTSLSLPAGSTFTISGDLNMNVNSITSLGTINFSGSVYDTNAPITANQINVSELNISGLGVTLPAALTINNPVTVTNGINIGPNAGLILSYSVDLSNPAMNTIFGSVINNGGVLSTTINPAINVPTTYRISGDLITNGTFQPTIASMSNYSQLAVGGNATVSGVIDVAFSGNTSDTIQSGNTFDVLTTPLGTAINYDPNTVVTSPFLLLSFSRNPNADPSVLQLIATRKNIAEVNIYQPLNGIAQALDQMIVTNTLGPLDPIINELESAETLADLENDLAQLVPTGVNGGDIMSSIMSLKGAWDTTTYRLDLLRQGFDPYDPYAGYAGGDIASCRSTYGPLVFGNVINQKKRNGIPGYSAYTGGVGIFADAPITAHGRVGGWIGYASTSKKDEGSTGNTLTMNGGQIGLYGSLDIGCFFVDGLVAAASNKYQSRRHIVFFTPNQTMQGKFNGYQYGGRFRAGLPVPLTSWMEFTPIFTTEYMRVVERAYKETGSVAALSVQRRATRSAETGGGFRLADTSNLESYYVEIHALVLWQARNPSFQITSQFIAAGPPFVAGDPAPFNDTSYNFGFSGSAYITRDLILMGSYDVEAKTKFVSHFLTIKLKWVF